MTNKVETNDILVNDEDIDENTDENTYEDSSIIPVAKCDLVPISHKDFNEFIKGKGFTERNKYRLKELKVMFGFKPLTYKNQTRVNIDDGKEFKDYESILKASIGSGIPHTTLIQAKKKSKSNIKSNSKSNPDAPIPIRSGGNVYVIKFNNYI